jgi:hypothetical protein
MDELAAEKAWIDEKRAEQMQQAKLRKELQEEKLRKKRNQEF